METPLSYPAYRVVHRRKSFHNARNTHRKGTHGGVDAVSQLFRLLCINITMWKTVWIMCKTLWRRQFSTVSSRYGGEVPCHFFQSFSLFCQTWRGRGSSLQEKRAAGRFCPFTQGGTDGMIKNRPNPRTCIHNRGMPDRRGFFPSGKGNRRSMAGKRPAKRRSTVVNTGSYPGLPARND